MDIIISRSTSGLLNHRETQRGDIMVKIIVPFNTSKSATCEYGCEHCISSCIQCDRVDGCVVNRFWEEVEFQTAGT